MCYVNILPKTFVIIKNCHNFEESVYLDTVHDKVIKASKWFQYIFYCHMVYIVCLSYVVFLHIMHRYEDTQFFNEFSFNVVCFLFSNLYVVR